MLTEEQQGIKDFIDEVSGDINSSESVLCSLSESGSCLEEINTLFRLFHNIKGVSGMFDWQTIQEVFHISESILVFYRDQKICPPQETCDILLKSIDYFKDSAKYFLENGKFNLKKPYELLFQLDKYLSELIDSTTGNSSTGTDKDKKEKVSKKEKDESIRISSEKGEELMEIVSNFIQLQNKLITVLNNTSDSLALKSDIQRFSSHLQNFALSIRLSPLQPMLSGMNRIVNSASRELNKRIKLKINGGETQLDRRVLDLLREPLIHMVRNAVDHGIETIEERAACKKSDTGIVTIDAYQQSGQVVIVMSDDGKGIDAQKLLKKALEKNIINEKNIPASNREILNLIFHPGFSTAEKVTNLSGRGVGMDAVKTAVESIGGNVDLETEVGNGTRFKLTLPLSLAIVKSLTFNIGKQIYAIPQVNVEEVVTLEMLRNNREISVMSDGTHVISRRKQVIPVINLDSYLKGFSDDKSCVYIITKYRGSRFALKVNRIKGNRDFVSQPCPPLFSAVDVISGVTQLNSGEYIALLDLGILETLVENKKALADNNSNLTTDTSTLSDLFRGQQKMVFFRSARDFALAVQNIKQVFQIEKNSLQYLGDKCFIGYQGKTYPVLRLYSLFGKISRIKEQAFYTVLLVSREEYVCAILCEEFYGIFRLPNEFDDTLKDKGILGITNFENRPYLVPNLRTIFAMEFPEKYFDGVGAESMDNKFTVLIVEDDKFFAANLSEFLSTHGFQHVHCLNGLDAKNLLTSMYIEKKSFMLSDKRSISNIDYIVTDYEMPQMNGLELLSWVRKTQETKSLPVTMCTAVADSQTKTVAMSLGIESYTGKLKYDIFLQDILNKKKQMDIGVGPTTTKVNAGNPATAEAQNVRLLTFSIGDQVYAIDIMFVKEISLATISTAIPGMPSYASKIVAFRGNPIPVIDLRKTSLLDSDQNGESKQVVVQIGKHICALWVDQVFNVRRIENMHKSVGINKRNFGSLHALIKDVLWDQDKKCIAFLGNDRLEIFLEKTIKKVQKLLINEDKVDNEMLSVDRKDSVKAAS